MSYANHGTNESVFTNEVIEFLAKETKTSEMAVGNFKILLESRMSNDTIKGIAKNWMNNTTAMKSNIAVVTVGHYYVLHFMWLMEYLYKTENELLY